MRRMLVDADGFDRGVNWLAAWKASMILRCVFRPISFPFRAGVFPGIRCRELRIVGILGIWEGGARKGEGRGKANKYRELLGRASRSGADSGCHW